MALSNYVQLRDGMSNVLGRIASNLSAVNNRFERLQGLAEQAVPTDIYSQLNSELVGIREEFTRTVSAVEELRDSLSSAQPPAENLMGTLKRLGTVFVGSKIVTGLVGMSDELAQTTARLNLMNDGLQSTADLQEMIYQSAMRSRSAYADTAAAASKMGLLAGDAFNSNQETIAFVEQLNKQFKIAGTSTEGQAAAMLQLTQAMGAGVLRGEELNSVFEHAPTVIQAIADYLGVSVGEIRSMAQEGEITAGIVKSALLSAAEETNRKFEEIPRTWEDVWVQATNMALMALQPLLTGINWVANNLDIIAPLVLAAGTAFAIFAIAANWTNICTAAVKGLAAAQALLNAVMALNPVVLVIGSLIILIGLISAVIADINKVQGTTFSVMGAICGVIMAGLAFIGNLLAALWNLIVDGVAAVMNMFVSLANFIGNVFEDPIGAAARLFFEFVDSVLGLLQSLASAIDTIFGSNLAGSVSGWRDSLSGWVDTTFGRGIEIVPKVDPSYAHIGRFEYSTAYNAGYNWGANLQNSILDKLGLNPPEDPSTDLLSNIADNTARIADDIEMSSEDLELLRAIAERQEINRYTTAEIRIEMVNHNNISSEMDIDGVVNLLEAKVAEQVAIAAEGVHI